ncbi:hypothetical protein [Acinetobacter sp. P1(2025)]|uniref:hypothetical protein n=1 Tax=Acinetobacter sp. P1(2025) TaxID=3446120 RepID=UPI003F52C859
MDLATLGFISFLCGLACIGIIPYFVIKQKKNMTELRLFVHLALAFVVFSLLSQFDVVKNIGISRDLPIYSYGVFLFAIAMIIVACLNSLFRKKSIFSYSGYIHTATILIFISLGTLFIGQ